MSEYTEIRNGRVVTPTTVLENGTLLLAGSRIAHVGPDTGCSSGGRRTIDADGQVVMPGMIDLHGDDIETQLYPRADAKVDTQTALITADRLNVLNGITTKFHAIAFEDTPSENRSIESTTELAREISAADYTLGNNHVHARCELVEESISAIESLLEEISIDLISVMHHAPDSAQFDAEEFKQHYVENRGWSSEDAAQLAADRSSISCSDRNRRAKHVAELAAENGIPLASHDDKAPKQVDRIADAGASICEYPVTMSAAERATEQGLVTAMGAPNLIRGESLRDNLSTRRAIRRGLIDVLCADYHPPSLLAAPFVESGDESLAERIARVTVTPADVVGLDDRGRIEAGARADVLIVDPEPVPTVDRVFLEGKEVFRTNQRAERPTRPDIGA